MDLLMATLFLAALVLVTGGVLWAALGKLVAKEQMFDDWWNVGRLLEEHARHRLVASVICRPVPTAMGEVEDYEVLIAQLNTALAGGKPNLSAVAVYNSEGKLVMLFPPKLRPFRDIDNAGMMTLEEAIRARTEIRLPNQDEEYEDDPE